MIRLSNSFILCYKFIEVEHFPSEDWMSAAINQMDQLIFTPTILPAMFTHSEHFPSK